VPLEAFGIVCTPHPPGKASGGGCGHKRT
jgi:hypothetical protein